MSEAGKSKTTDDDTNPLQTAYEAGLGGATELTAALQRADKLIRWMSSYIGNMAPGDYAECYRDLNEHGMFMDRLAGVLIDGR